MRVKVAILTLLQAFVLSKALVDRSLNLYKQQQPGIVSFESKEVAQHVFHSTKPWLVQFYASWCGHCRRFESIFSEFGVQVQGWREFIGIGVINCAAEHNTQTCRDFDIEGYPGIKFFPPNSAPENLGEFNFHHDSVDQLLKSTADWIEKQQSIPENAKYFVNVPDLTPMQKLDDLWTTQSSAQKEAKHAILLITDEAQDFSIGEIILDLSAITKNLSDQLIARKVDVTQPSGRSIISHLNLNIDKGSLPTIVAVDRAVKNVKVIGQGSEKGSKEVLKRLIYQYYRELFPKVDLEKAEKQLKRGGKQEATEQDVKKTQSEEAVRVRRYTAHLLDVELALEYALNHEVGQRKVIGGQSLKSLQNFMEVLTKYFPGEKRPRTMAFIKELRHWVNQHDDAIKGVEFSAKVKEIKRRLGAFAHEKKSFIGCKGTSPNYGGYPCGLWTLWHTLTASHLEVDPNNENVEENRFVLMAMYQYIDSYFGCRDCARHFGQMAEKGEAITRDVQTVSDSVLWLWRAHNRVNQRLSGDISDDPGFPKKTFPDKQHCSNCYNENVATHDLWREFNKNAVRDFLLQLYSTDLDYEGLKEELPLEKDSAPAGSPLLNARDHSNDRLPGTRDKFHGARSRPQFSHDVTTTWVMSMGDIGLCFLIYVGSFLLMSIICYKFYLKRTLSTYLRTFLKTNDHFRTGSYDPLKMV